MLFGVENAGWSARATFPKRVSIVASADEGKSSIPGIEAEDWTSQKRKLLETAHTPRQAFWSNSCIKLINFAEAGRGVERKLPGTRSLHRKHRLWPGGQRQISLRRR